MVEQEQAVSRVRNSPGESLTAMKPDTARIRLVRSLDAGLGDSVSLSLGADGSRLLLYTAAAGRCPCRSWMPPPVRQSRN